jgi:CRP-like cAMP-binding protein
VSRRDATAPLRALPELARLERREVASLLPHFDEVNVARGATLAHAGRPATAYFVVLAGSLEAHGPHGTWTIRAGQSVGWDAMWNRRPSATTVSTAEPSRLLVMGRAQFRAVRALRARIEQRTASTGGQPPRAAVIRSSERHSARAGMASGRTRRTRAAASSSERPRSSR